MHNNIESIDPSIKNEQKNEPNNEYEDDNIEKDKENIQENKNDIRLPLDSNSNSYVKENTSQISPIYEAVMLSPLNTRLHGNNINVSSLEEQNIGLHTSISSYDNQKDHQNAMKREMSPSAMKQRIRLYKSTKLQDPCTEREQRRKYRVEKKLQQIHQNSHDILGEVANNDIQFDIMEFISNYFNIHEKPPSNDIIATLTRKNKKNINLMSHAEMISFQKHDKIPSSHIHMYDPENVVLSCDIFHVGLSIIEKTKST